MKIVVDTGERILIVVPSRTGSSSAIAVETDIGTKVADIATESGLLDNMTEHVARRRDVPKIKEDKLPLWAHIVSQHACIMPTDASLKDLIDYHNHEHEGPGTIRNHDPASRESSLHRIGEVLIEAEPSDG